MPSCVCGQFFYVQSYRMDPKESVELCPRCLQASQPKSYVNSKEWTQGCCVDNSGSASVVLPED